MWQAYGHYEKGFLPLPGGWLDQSATFCAAMGHIGHLVSIHLDKDRHG